MKYNFISSGDKEVDKVLKIFDRQIKQEYKKADGKKENCPSYWNKLLFLKTFDLEFCDWVEIRTDKYWTIRDSLCEIEQTKFILEKVEYYNTLK